MYIAAIRRLLLYKHAKGRLVVGRECATPPHATCEGCVGPVQYACLHQVCPPPQVTRLGGIRLELKAIEYMLTMGGVDIPHGTFSVLIKQEGKAQVLYRGGGKKGRGRASQLKIQHAAKKARLL